MIKGTVQKSMNAVGYVRGVDTEMQQQAISRYCAAKGYRLMKVFTDDVSGAETGHHFLHLIEEAEEGNFEVVVVQSLDRISRSAGKIATHIQELEQMHVSVEIVSA